MNRTIKAKFHESALKRVTRMYGASVKEIFAELFQNARRSGATRIDVIVRAPTSADGPRPVEVRDNGAGIGEAQDLLSYGENGWEKELVEREDAAGMGLLSLARRGCVVRTRTAEAAPWRVELLSGHFTGEDGEAEVEEDHEPLEQQGSSIAFEVTAKEGSPGVIATSAKDCAKYLPVRVLVHGEGDTAEEANQAGFLDGAVHTETWEGIRFGVFHSKRAHPEIGPYDINFYGVTVRGCMGGPTTVNAGSWAVRADVVDCPKLELVLPGREKVVENEFLGEVRKAGLHATYRAMTKVQDPRPSYTDFTAAREVGIEIPEAAPVLRRWTAAIADSEDNVLSNALDEVGEESLVMECDPPAQQAQSIERAAEANATGSRFMIRDRHLEGYPWYDALPKAKGFTIKVHEGGKCRLAHEDGEPTGETWKLPDQVDRIEIVLQVREGESEREIKLNSDLVAVSEDWCSSLEETKVMVVKEHRIGVRELTEFLKRACFKPSTDSGSDSYERQLIAFQDEALYQATQIVGVDPQEIRHQIEKAFKREVRLMVPAGHRLRIVQEGPSGATEIELEKIAA